MNKQDIDSKNTAYKVTLLILRIALGGLMFEAGLTKLLSGTFSAAGFLEHVSGPFAGFYTGITGNPAFLGITNVLVPWGETLIGIAIILGIAVRFASFWGIILMFLYYTAALPPANGWISQEIIYIAVFLTFMFTGTGYYLGLDRLAIKLEEKRHSLRILLG
ncbi:MAG: DoxX family protein [Dehalococcoidia bacterium]